MTHSPLKYYYKTTLFHLSLFLNIGLIDLTTFQYNLPNISLPKFYRICTVYLYEIYFYQIYFYQTFTEYPYLSEISAIHISVRSYIPTKSTIEHHFKGERKTTKKIAQNRAKKTRYDGSESGLDTTRNLTSRPIPLQPRTQISLAVATCVRARLDLGPTFRPNSHNQPNLTSTVAHDP